METTLNKRSIFHLSEKRREIIFDAITFIFIMLFIYTAASKIMTFASFEKVLGRAPLIGQFNTLIAYLIPTIESIISIILLFNSTKRIGLLLSLGLMIIFTIYLIYMISLGVPLPCHCGGVISLLTWKQHIAFNLVFIVLAILGLKIYRK